MTHSPNDNHSHQCSSGCQHKPISDVIRERLVKSGERFHSNDNISKHIHEGERELLQKEVEEKIRQLLHSLVIDTENDHNTNETAKRVAKMYVQEVFGGRYVEQPSATTFPNATNYDGIYISGPISIRSTCAHHFQNITGSAWIGILPGESVIGLSKFNRLVDFISSRPQIQEEMTTQIADIIQEATGAKGVAVVVKAEHHCMTHRGVKEHESDMTTVVLRGAFKEDPELKNEFITLLAGMKQYSE